MLFGDMVGRDDLQTVGTKRDCEDVGWNGRYWRRRRMRCLAFQSCDPDMPGLG
jgi:hypothetical protein